MCTFIVFLTIEKLRYLGRFCEGWDGRTLSSLCSFEFGGMCTSIVFYHLEVEKFRMFL